MLLWRGKDNRCRPYNISMYSTDHIKILREKTGAGISDIQRALEESGGDIAKATQIIERRLGGLAEKRLGRETRAGLVDAYIHSNARVGAMLELYCETDFVARNPAFKELAHDLAMHIAAMSPWYLSLDTVPVDIWEVEKSRFADEVRALGKPPHIFAEIVDGKLKSYFGSRALLSQPFVKDQDKTVGEVVNEAIGKFGENIRIGRFVKLEL